MHLRLLLLPFLLLASAAAPARRGEDEVLRLRDGRLLVGEIVQHDLDGLTVVSALHGGRYRLSWKDLFPGEAERLKAGFGYREETSVPEVLADRLLLKNGMQILGRILRDDASAVEIRVGRNIQRIRKDRLAAPPDQVPVPATEILTPEQFYAERVSEVPEDDALAQYGFALELELVFALEPALEHLERARVLAEAGGDAPLLRRLETARRRIETRLEHRAESEALQEIRVLMNRERFTAAEELLEQWPERFPDAALEGEYLELRDRFAGRRQEAMERVVSQRWYNTAVGLLKRAAVRDRNRNVEAIMEWLSGELPMLIRQEIAEDLEDYKVDIDPAEIDGLWMARFEHSPKRHSAGYGDGTWLLGEERALAGLEPEEETEENDPRKEFEQRIQQYLDNLERARRARQDQGEDEVTPEAFWRRWSPTSRFQWMLAYYAEFSGDYRIRSVSFQDCPTCAGTGVLRITDINAEGSRSTKRVCPTCHGISKRRKVTFY